MKKVTILSLGLAALLATSSCSGNTTCNSTNCGDDREEYYTGVLPAADVEGIRYQLELEFDADDNYMEGDYKLVETYLVADSTAVGGVTDGEVVRTKGDFTVRTKPGTNVKYLKLVPDRKYTSASTLYFLVDNDNSITLTTETLEQPVSGLNYTLTRR